MSPSKLSIPDGAEDLPYYFHKKFLFTREFIIYLMSPSKLSIPDGAEDLPTLCPPCV